MDQWSRTWNRIVYLTRHDRETSGDGVIVIIPAASGVFVH